MAFTKGEVVRMSSSDYDYYDAVIVDIAYGVNGGNAYIVRYGDIGGNPDDFTSSYIIGASKDQPFNSYYAQPKTQTRFRPVYGNGTTGGWVKTKEEVTALGKRSSSGLAFAISAETSDSGKTFTNVTKVAI